MSREIRKSMSKAIANKVNSILENTDRVVNMNIHIFANKDEMPAIRYSIEELIETRDHITKAIEEKGGEFDD